MIKKLFRELRSGEPELHFLPKLCSRDADFLDVGANAGVYAFFAQFFARRVHAMEVHPDLQVHLRNVLGRKCSVIPKGASNEIGSATLFVPKFNGISALTRCSLQRDANGEQPCVEVAVQTTTLDALRMERIGCIKIDVEGHELAVLEGASAILATQRPNVIVECEERHNQGGVARLGQFMDAAGYRGYYLMGGRMKRMAEFDPDVMQCSTKAKTFGSAARDPNYVNNFLFVHPENSAAYARLEALAQTP